MLWHSYHERQHGDCTYQYCLRRGDRGAPRDCYQGNKKILVAALLTSLIYVSTNKSCYQGVTGHFTGFCTDNGYCMYCNKYGLVFRREIVTRVSMKFSWRRVSSLYCLPFCYQGITEILVAAKYDTMVFYVGISTKVLRSPSFVNLAL